MKTNKTAVLASMVMAMLIHRSNLIAPARPETLSSPK